MFRRRTLLVLLNRVRTAGQDPLSLDNDKLELLQSLEHHFGDESAAGSSQGGWRRIGLRGGPA